MFEIIKCAGSEVPSRLEELRKAFPVTKRYPIILGDEKEKESQVERSENDERQPEVILANSFEIDITSWFRSQETEAQEDELDRDELLGDWSEEEELDRDELVGDWSEEEAQEQSIQSHLDILTGEVKPVIYLGLAAIERPWMIASVLKYGNWNDCPDAAVQCAIMRYWEAEYGAEIVSMTDDTIECIVKNPPTTKTAALQLAWEQYWYCGDIVNQGTRTISNLAAELLNSPYWFFWWD
jgi:hypothetical protein